MQREAIFWRVLLPASPGICLIFNFETVSKDSPGWPGHPCESASWVEIFNCPILLSLVFEGGGYVPILCAGSCPQHPSLKEGLKDHRDQDTELPSPAFFLGGGESLRKACLWWDPATGPCFTFSVQYLVGDPLLMLCSGLIHTSVLINYSVYPLIRCSDRVNKYFLGLVWDCTSFKLGMMLRSEI